MVEEAVLPRPKKAPRRLQDGDAVEHYFLAKIA